MSDDTVDQVAPGQPFEPSSAPSAAQDALQLDPSNSREPLAGSQQRPRIGDSRPAPPQPAAQGGAATTSANGNGGAKRRRRRGGRGRGTGQGQRQGIPAASSNDDQPESEID